MTSGGEKKVHEVLCRDGGVERGQMGGVGGEKLSSDFGQNMMY